MKIALFSDTYKPDINGVASSVEALNIALTRAGHTVVVVCSGTQDEVDFTDNILRLPGKQLKSLYGYTLTSPWHHKATKILREYDPDVIHVHTEFGCGIYGKRVARMLNKPLVLTYHTFYEDYTHYANPADIHFVENLERAAVRKLSSFWCNKCDHIIVPTEKTRDRLRDYGVTSDMTIIPTSVDLEGFLNCNTTVGDFFNEDVYKLIFVGRLAEEKRVAEIIRAVRKVNDSEVRCGLIIVGDGPDSHKLKMIARSNKLDDLVKFTGKIPHDEVAAFYRKADCFISASLSETQGMTFIEAMACGIPVLACDEVALKNVLVDGENGYYFHSSQQLAEKISLLIAMDDQQKAAVRENCLNKASEYSLESFASKASEVYRRVLNHD